MDYIQFEPNAIYTMDKAYVDLVVLNQMDSIGTYFVTRAKTRMQYRIIEGAESVDESVLADHLVLLISPKSSQLYPKLLRVVHYYDAEINDELTFISNNMDISVLDFTNIYRNR